MTALVPYRGAEAAFGTSPPPTCCRARRIRADLKDRIVLVGTTAPGLLDLRSDPGRGVYPGVEIHANLISGMLDGTIKQTPPYVLGAEVPAAGPVRAGHGAGPAFA